MAGTLDTQFTHPHAPGVDPDDAVPVAAGDERIETRASVVQRDAAGVPRYVREIEITYGYPLRTLVASDGRSVTTQAMEVKSDEAKDLWLVVAKQPYTQDWIGLAKFLPGNHASNEERHRLHDRILARSRESVGYDAHETKSTRHTAVLTPAHWSCKAPKAISGHAPRVHPMNVFGVCADPEALVADLKNSDEARRLLAEAEDGSLLEGPVVRAMKPGREAWREPPNRRALELFEAWRPLAPEVLELAAWAALAGPAGGFEAYRDQPAAMVMREVFWAIFDALNRCKGTGRRAAVLESAVQAERPSADETRSADPSAIRERVRAAEECAEQLDAEPAGPPIMELLAATEWEARYDGCIAAVVFTRRTADRGMRQKVRGRLERLRQEDPHPAVRVAAQVALDPIQP